MTGEEIDFSELKSSNLLPSPKGAMLAVLRLCQREEVGFSELSRAIAVDPVLAGRVIKLANALNPGRQRPFAAVSTDVLILVGVHAVRQLVLGIGLVASCRQGACAEFDYERFWSRSVAIACAAQVLGAHVPVAPVAELFSCGLLSGVGRLALASARPQSYSRLLVEMADAGPESICAAEAALFGFDHLSLSAMMMADWNIPRLFCDAVVLHETPGACAAAASSRQMVLVRLLYAAGLIGEFCCTEPLLRPAQMARIDDAIRELGIEAVQAEKLLECVVDDWIDWGRALDIKQAANRP